ncbi:MAG: hypothetical protein ACJAS1_007127 [Oleiphilaceae bacterium]|jgi:hypothetical protein
MSRLVQISALMFLLMFVFVEIAEAKLIRGVGKGSISYQHETYYYFVENQNVVELSNFTGMSQAAFDDRNTGFGVTTKTVGGGGSAISAVPTSGFSASDNCNNSYDFGQVAPADDPCEWSISQGDNLTAFGSFSLFFDNPLIDHEIVWTISGNGVNKTINGRVNEGPTINTPDGVIGTGQVMLDALWSDLDLLPGIYDISVSALISSTAGQFFRETVLLGSDSTATPIDLIKEEENNPAYDEWSTAIVAWQNDVLFPWLDDPNRQLPEPTFDTPEPPQTLVAYIMDDYSNGYRAPSNSLAVDSRFSLLQNFGPEILRIEASSINPPINPVNAPAVLTLVSLGGLFAFMRRRKHINT